MTSALRIVGTGAFLSVWTKGRGPASAEVPPQEWGPSYSRSSLEVVGDTGFFRGTDCFLQLRSQPDVLDCIQQGPKDNQEPGISTSGFGGSSQDPHQLTLRMIRCPPVTLGICCPPLRHFHLSLFVLGLVSPDQGLIPQQLNASEAVDGKRGSPALGSASCVVSGSASPPLQTLHWQALSLKGSVGPRLVSGSALDNMEWKPE